MEDYNNDAPRNDKSTKGLQIIIVVLALILGVLSVLYFRQVNQMKKENEELTVERDTLSNRFEVLVEQYDNIKTENDAISENLSRERNRADSLRQRIQKERSWSNAKVREYEKELGTLRTVMRAFVYQIDSLNTLNKKLADENIKIRTDANEQRARADKAEEQASELTTKVRKGGVVRVRDIAMVTLSSSDREVTRASRASRVRVDFVLSANELAHAGERNVYMSLTGPDGYVIANASGSTFEFEGSRIAYTAVRSVDYQNTDLPVSIYYNGSGITAGTYKVTLYMDGYRVGSSEVLLR